MNPLLTKASPSGKRRKDKSLTSHENHLRQAIA